MRDSDSNPVCRYRVPPLLATRLWETVGSCCPGVLVQDDTVYGESQIMRTSCLGNYWML